MGWLSDQNPELAARIEEDRVASFEETVVKRILRHANVPFTVAGLKAMASREMNEPVISLTFFNRQYPRFPVTLGAARLKWMHKLQVGDLFGKHFMQLPCMRAYQNFCESTALDPRTDRLGLIFNWPGIEVGGASMVLHNYPVTTDTTPDPDLRTERGTRLVRPYGNPVVVYVIEAFQDFLRSVGTDWAQE